jgi:hypothetical protein
MAATRGAWCTLEPSYELLPACEASTRIGYMVCQVVTCVEGNRLVPISMADYEEQASVRPVAYRERAAIAAVAGKDQPRISPGVEAASAPPGLSHGAASLGYSHLEPEVGFESSLAAMPGTLVLASGLDAAGFVEPAPGTWEPAPGYWTTEHDETGVRPDVEGISHDEALESASRTRQFMSVEESPCSKHAFCPIDDVVAEEQRWQPSGEPFREPSPNARRRLASTSNSRAHGAKARKEKAVLSDGVREVGGRALNISEGRALEARRPERAGAPTASPLSALPVRYLQRSQRRERWNSTLTTLCLDARSGRRR